MINQELLGRYEYHGHNPKNVSQQSDKFWHIIYDRTSQEYAVRFGSTVTGRGKGTPYVYLGDAKATKKIIEKIKKGYEKVSGYEETVGSNAVNFIMAKY